MWVEFERFDFTRNRVVKVRRWVDLDIVVKTNPLLQKAARKEFELKEPRHDK